MVLVKKVVGNQVDNIPSITTYNTQYAEMLNFFWGSPHPTPTTILFAPIYEGLNPHLIYIRNSSVVQSSIIQLLFHTHLRKTHSLNCASFPQFLRVNISRKNIQNYIIQIKPIFQSWLFRFSSLRIMGSQDWWFGDPRTLLYRFKSLYRRVQ